MSTSAWSQQLSFVRTAFDRTTSCFEETDEAFAPASSMFTVAQQVAHVAQTIDWFLEGAFRAEGFDLDFPALERKVCAVETLAAARRWWEASIGRAIQVFDEQDAGAFERAIAEGPIMGGLPRHEIVGGIADHTAHHRGSLATYARLAGKTPPMPYG